MRLRFSPTRRGIGAIIAAAGALLVAASSYVSWYAGEDPRAWPLQQLFQASPAGIASAYWGSVAAPLAVVGILGVLGALLRFRFILGLGWLLGVATVLLWVTMRAIAGTWDSEQLEGGFLLALGSLAILLTGILVMGPRHEEVEAPLSVFDDIPPE